MNIEMLAEVGARLTKIGVDLGLDKVAHLGANGGGESNDGGEGWLALLFFGTLGFLFGPGIVDFLGQFDKRDEWWDLARGGLGVEGEHFGERLGTSNSLV